ncbi:MAG: AAA family ATPase [Arenicella sp.]
MSNSDKKIKTDIHLIFGTQGAGKSTYSRHLAKTNSAVYLSIDQWMAELFARDMPVPMNIGWIMERVQRCEKMIWSTTSSIFQAGGETILDLGFMKVANRNQFRSLAETAGACLQMHYISATRETRLQRVMSRNSEQGDTFSFEVTPSMFHFMEAEFEPPTEEERSLSIEIDTNQACQAQ